MKRRSIRITFVIIAVAAAAAIVIGALVRHAAGAQATRGDSCGTSASRIKELYVQALRQRQRRRIRNVRESD